MDEYSHNTVNEYTQVILNGVTKTPVYDDAGNMTQDPCGYQYSYDYENRLTEVKDPCDSVVATYSYDALGRRIVKDAGSETTQYYYDGWRVLSEHDGEDGDTPLLRYFVYGNYLDEVVMMRNVQDEDAYVDDKDFYFMHNHLFSPVALVKEDGVIVERTEYDVYGKPKTWLIADVDFDGDVDNDDLIDVFIPSYGSNEGDPCYNWYCDFNNDGYINSSDSPIFSALNGKSVDPCQNSFFKNRRVWPDSCHSGHAG